MMEKDLDTGLLKYNTEPPNRPDLTLWYYSTLNRCVNVVLNINYYQCRSLIWFVKLF